jgi:hypothetical protein
MLTVHGEIRLESPCSVIIASISRITHARSKSMAHYLAIRDDDAFSDACKAVCLMLVPRNYETFK